MLLIAVLPMIAAAQDSASGAREWGKRSGAFQLSIASDKMLYNEGEFIVVTSILKNVTDEPAVLTGHASPFGFYDIDVRMPIADWIPNAAAPRAALTSLGLSQKIFLSGSTAGHSLKPGAEFRNAFELNRLYEMSATGDYHVIFSCRLPSHTGRNEMVTITSNELIITVLKKQAP